MNGRINAAAIRVRGFLEMASALYETSLPELGGGLRLSIIGRDSEISFATGGLQLIRQVAQGKVTVGWVNPTGALAMAIAGKGGFKVPLPLRALGVFPSWDRMGFAVAADTGITSLAQVRERRYPLRVSTRFPSRDDATMFAVDEVLKVYGFSLNRIRRWGGEIRPVPNPRHPARADAIRNRAVDAVFDEGLKSWAGEALAHGMRFLPLDEPALAHMESLGFRRGLIPQSAFPGLSQDVMTLDFSGWPVYVHAQMPAEVAYALCQAIDLRKDRIAVDRTLELRERTVDLHQLCTDSEECPKDVPLHPGAERYYREKGFYP